MWDQEKEIHIHRHRDISRYRRYTQEDEQEGESWSLKGGLSSNGPVTYLAITIWLKGFALRFNSCNHINSITFTSIMFENVIMLNSMQPMMGLVVN